MSRNACKGRSTASRHWCAAGEIIFWNLTAKTTLPGRYPVEIAHVVPAPAAGQRWKTLGAAMRSLVKAVGFGSGMLHAEWMIDGDSVSLVECAGRAPGDHICDLVDLAYGTQITLDWVTVLADREVAETRPPTRAAAVRFLTTPPGRVMAVSGVEDARRARGVTEVEVGVGEGDVVPPCRSSWDRCGHVIATGPGPELADRLASQAAALVRITTEAHTAGSWR